MLLPQILPNQTRCFACGLLLLVPSFLLDRFKDKARPIVISSATTHITKPLRPDGLPDYERYLLQHYRKGVKPEQNAAVLLWQAMWPGELEPADYGRFSRELGLSIPSTDAVLKPIYAEPDEPQLLRWLSDNGYPNATSETAELVLTNMIARPWKPADFPPIVDWLRDNESAIDMIVDATKRLRFYSPSPSLLDSDVEPLVELRVPSVPLVRIAAKTLALRAMSHLGQGQIESAWRDISAIYRLSRLQCQAESVIEQLVAIQIDRIASRATLAVLSHNAVSRDELRQIDLDLQKFRTFNGLANSFDGAERLLYLDSVLHLKDGRAKGWQELLGLDESIVKVARSLSADWNVPLRRGNEYYDRLVTIAAMPRGIARDHAISQIHAEHDRLEKEASDLKRLVRMNQQQRGVLFAALTIALFPPDIEKVLMAQDAANTRMALTRLSASITVYRAQRGVIPEQLDNLVPHIIHKKPLDPYSGKPFLYKPLKDGFLLYSVGENGNDDGASNERERNLKGRPLDELGQIKADETMPQIPAGADDITIRLPRPAFELPKLPASPE